MRKLLLAASSLIALGAISFTNKPILAGTDHLADALLDVSSHSKQSTRLLALKVLDDEAQSDLPELFHNVVTTGKVTTNGEHKGKTLPEMMRMVPSNVSIFKSSTPAITLTPFNLDRDVPSNINRTVAHPLGVSLHFAAQDYPNFSGDLVLTCAGITARSTFTFAGEVLKPENFGLLAGTIGMTENNLHLYAEFDTHLSPHVQNLLDTVKRLRLELEEARSQLANQRHGSRSTSGSRATDINPQRERQMLLEKMGMTKVQLEAFEDPRLTKFLTVPAAHMETIREVRSALEGGIIYKAELGKEESEEWNEIEDQLRRRLTDLEEEE